MCKIHVFLPRLRRRGEGGREGEREKGHPFNNMARSISLPDIDPTAGKVRPNGRRAFG